MSAEDYLASRRIAVAKHVAYQAGRILPTVGRELDPELVLHPSFLYTTVHSRAATLVTEAALAAFEQSRIATMHDATVAQEQRHDMFVYLLPRLDTYITGPRSFLSNAVMDSISATRALPRMPFNQAHEVVRHATTLENFRTYARSGVAPQEPTDNMPYAHPYLKYDSEQDALVRTATELPPPRRNGCPIANGAGPILGRVFVGVADITIAHLGVPDSHERHFVAY